jgi:hypothetical protein
MRKCFLWTSNTIGQCYITLTIILFSFSRQMSPLSSVLSRQEKIHFIVFMTYFSTNEPSLIECASHNLLSHKFCSIASLSTLIYYYIVISLHNNIYWSTSSSLLIIFVNIFPLADFDLTLSLRWRFLFFVVDHDICAAKDSLPFYVVKTSFLLFRLLCFQSRVSKKESFAWTQASVQWLSDARSWSGSHAAPLFRLLHHYSSWLFSCSACPTLSFIHFDSFTHFISLCIIHFECIHSLIHSFIHSFIHSLPYAWFGTHFIRWLICCASRCGEIEDLVDGATRGGEITRSARVYRVCCMPW